MTSRNPLTDAGLAELAGHAGMEAPEAADVLAAAFGGLELKAPPRLRGRLLDALAPAWHRFEARLASLCDLSVEAAREILAHAESARHWTDGPIPGVSLFHIEAGPARSGADVGLVRLGAGVAFPPHRHLGPETVILLDGSYVDDVGVERRAGDPDDRTVGDPHGFVAGADGAVLAVVLYAGIAIADPHGGPDIIVKG